MGSGGYRGHPHSRSMSGQYPHGAGIGAGGSGGYSDTEVTVAGVGGGDRYYRDPYVEGTVGPRYHHASGGAVGGSYGADPTGKPDISSFFLPSA